MKRIKLTNNQKSNLKRMLDRLFPEFKYISIEKDNTVRFSGIKKNSIKNGIATLLNIENTVKIPVFELLITQFPQRLSILKSGNKSFAAIFLIHAMYMVNIDPNGIVDYFIETFDSIKNPYRINDIIEEVIKEANEYENLKFEPEFEFRSLKERLDADNVSINMNVEKMRRMTHKQAKNYAF